LKAVRGKREPSKGRASNPHSFVELGEKSTIIHCKEGPNDASHQAHLTPISSKSAPLISKPMSICITSPSAPSLQGSHMPHPSTPSLPCAPPTSMFMSAHFLYLSALFTSECAPNLHVYVCIPFTSKHSPVRAINSLSYHRVFSVLKLKSTRHYSSRPSSKRLAIVDIRRPVNRFPEHLVFRTICVIQFYRFHPPDQGVEQCQNLRG